MWGCCVGKTLTWAVSNHFVAFVDAFWLTFSKMEGLLHPLAKAGLHLEEPLVVRFLRSETETFVPTGYQIDEERMTDIFNMFLRVRDIHQDAEGTLVCNFLNDFRCSSDFWEP